MLERSRTVATLVVVFASMAAPLVAQTPAPATPAAPAAAPARPQQQSVDPGMTREQVVAVLGAPITARSLGPRTYLFYPNGRERRAGMYDLILLENDAVVDAIFRAPHRRYTGTSSSPNGVKAAPTNVVSVPVTEASAPGSPTPAVVGTGSTVLPSITAVPGGGRSAAAAPAATMNRPAEGPAKPTTAADTTRPRFVKKGDPMPPQPPRTIFPTPPNPARP